METNAVIDLVHEVQGQLWADKINETHRTGRLCPWVSTFHPDRLPCQLDGTFHHGAFNAGVKMVFSDNTAWMVRFPRVGMVCDEYMDEKVAMEVTALKLIHDRTTIPVPRVQVWGPAVSNSLGLGPFIIMDFIEGVSLSDLLQDPSAERPSRVMREDISDGDIEVIYRQMANFLLQLFKLDFDRIGSLPSPQTEAENPTPPRPLTFKAHSILQNGGVETFGDRAQGFSTTTEYFQYVAGQDWEQLIHQPNSTVGCYDAEIKYGAFKALKSLIPDLVNAKFDYGKFKLICDDLGLANLIVRSKEDLTVIGVVDFEWSYVGPAQLFGSAPWWLLQDRPVNSTWDCEGDEPPEIAARYFKCLEIFTRVLEEEEAKIPEHKERELSSLVKWSQASGAMWLHMLLSSGFNSPRSFPFTMLRRHLGPAEWERRESEFENEKETEAFAEKKVGELDQYDEALEKMEESIALVESGNMTKEEFIANALKEPGYAPCSSSNEMGNDEIRDAASPRPYSNLYKHIMYIPIELIVDIFGQLSPPNILSLATTCRKLYNAWQRHTNTIYNFINHAIQCEPDARILLADQGILPINSAMTVTGFLQLRRNAHVMEKIMERFGHEFIIPFCCPMVYPVDYGFYGGGPRPPYLTPTERPRFIRIVYRIWGLLLLNSTEARQQRIKRYKMKDLLSLEDIGPGYDPQPIDIITSVIMAEKQQPNPRVGLTTIPKVDRGIYGPEILDKIWDEVDHTAQYAYGCSSQEFHGWDEGGWWRGPVSLVDDCRPIFKDIVINAEYTNGERLVPVEEVWYDTSDGEIMD